MSAPHPGWDQLEPAAQNTPCDDDDQRIRLSLAISLKRIADAVSGDGPHHLIEGLRGPLTNIAWEAGRSFTAGQRTDR